MKPLNHHQHPSEHSLAGWKARQKISSSRSRHAFSNSLLLLLVSISCFLVSSPALQAQPQVTVSQLAAMKAVDPSSLPQYGTFWLLKGRTRIGSAPPMPCWPSELDDMDVSVYSLGDNQWLIDDSSVDYAAIDEERALDRLLMGPSLQDEEVPIAETRVMTTNDLYLTISSITNAIAQIGVHAPIPDAYDLFFAQTLPGSPTNYPWTWIYRTVPGETNVTVSIPPGNRFFILGGTNSSAGDGLSDAWKGLSGLDTNTWYDASISFGLTFPCTYTSATVVTGAVQVLSGFPSLMAVVVNPTNNPPFQDAVWIPMATNIPVMLANTGVNRVWVGLAGPVPDVTPVWQFTDIILDQSGPILHLTSPMDTNAPFPMIQLEGFSEEPLAELHCSVSNAVRWVSDIPGFVTSQSYNGITKRFTTNYWRFYDLDLDTNGRPNTVIVRATDLAGNVTTANYSFNFSTNNLPASPAVTVHYPESGAKLCGTNLTVRGQLQDPTARVVATLINSNGVLSDLAGVVERHGQFWVENIPLTAKGTNTLTLAVTDVAGNTTVTNLSFTAVDIGFTIQPVADDQLHLSITTVSGTIENDSYAVWVNGVEAEVASGGAWSAPNVPVLGNGTATFSARAYPAGEHPAPGSGGNGVNPSSPNALHLAIDEDISPQVRVVSYVGNREQNYGGTDRRMRLLAELPSGLEYHLHWNDMTNSTAWSVVYYTNRSCRLDDFWMPDCLVLHEKDLLVTGFETNSCSGEESIIGPPSVLIEHCEVADFQVYTNGTTLRTNSFWRDGQANLQLVTGGKALSHQLRLFQIEANATSVQTVRWPMEGSFSGTPIPPADLVVGAFGSPDASGRISRYLADNTTNDVTVTLRNTSPQTKYYIFDVTPTRQ